VRTVIEDTSVTEKVEAAKLRWLRADDAWNVVSWVVARDPTLGVAITESGNTRTFTYDGVQSIKMPTITVVYEITTTTVVIRDVDFQDAKYVHSGRG
jgi:hypothetical protein